MAGPLGANISTKSPETTSTQPSRELQGERRRHSTTVLRSLFRHCKKTGTILRPDDHARVDQRGRRRHLPLDPAEIERALATTTTPAARLTVAARRHPRGANRRDP